MTARNTATAVRRHVALDAAPVDLKVCCLAVGAETREAQLGAGRGGLQGMLVPLPGDRFRIAVDATPRGGWENAAGAARDLLRRRRVRFRVAHELGHTLFYVRSVDRKPTRRFPGGSLEEEAFCDEFARHLLVPVRAGRVTAENVVEDHERYDVSLELAARAAASREFAPTIALWRWDRPAQGRRAGLHVQWATDPRLAAEADVVQYRTDPIDLPRRFAAARRRLGEGFSGVVLPERRQALAVLT